MANFTQTNMSLDHYDWEAAPDDSRVTGEPDSTLFNRQQGYEVLYMLNTVLSASAPITALHKGEEMIRDELPSDKREQLDVKKWLDQRL
ncbi:hypothetical protein [Vreelandella glaciei]|uniref:hypothetical protein n=1 Tax=Vreelandella glaciei TaxID=186761 RepID=UPI0030030881|tara:strand:- start:20610 stop:20876 length:267 start_codon:yes stop_codon:yes gene_type:complete